jgi:hypothetical protein
MRASLLIGASVPKLKPAAIGLRTKTGRAIAIVAAGSREKAVGIHRAELIMSARATPATFQPFHAVMDLPWDQAELAARPAISAVEELASRSLATLLGDLSSLGFAVRTVGVVGAPERKLAAIGNPHIRAHAAEGVLFRHALEVAAGANALRSRALLEKGLYALAAEELGISAGTLTAHLARLGDELGRPWRADEKLAALAAWLVLS